MKQAAAQPRWILARNRRTWSAFSVCENLASCLVVRPAVRFRHIRNELGFISARINLITSPGDNPNWIVMASNDVRSSQAIMMIRSMSPRESSSGGGGVWTGGSFFMGEKMKRGWKWMAAVGGLVLGGGWLWNTATRAGYESAAYEVVEKDGDFEIRQYPDLMLASTTSQMNSQGRDGSFGRLFRYISGANEAKQKISMTTPVFMEGNEDEVSMGFVMPGDVAAGGVPSPTGEGVEVRRREGGLFAVIRFRGKLDSKLAREKEQQLRQWIESRGRRGSETIESAGYDPPFTPPMMRRNEVLIRLIDQ